VKQKPQVTETYGTNVADHFKGLAGIKDFKSIERNDLPIPELADPKDGQPIARITSTNPIPRDTRLKVSGTSGADMRLLIQTGANGNEMYSEVIFIEGGAKEQVFKALRKITLASQDSSIKFASRERVTIDAVNEDLPKIQQILADQELKTTKLESGFEFTTITAEKPPRL